MRIKRLILLVALTVSATGALGKKSEELADIPISHLQRFTSVIEHIKNYYVNQVEDSELFESALHGMLAGLDPHSSYLDKKEFAELQESTKGKYGGLGIVMSMEEGFPKVISPLDDSPAARAGIQSGDLIIRIDETPVKGLFLSEIADKLRGERGTKIKLTLLRQSQAKPIIVELMRELISDGSVKAKLIANKFGYLRISQFQSNTDNEMHNAIKKLRKESKDNNLSGLIIDLRNNPGGVVDPAIAIADAFLDKKELAGDGLIVYTKGRLPVSQLREVAHNGDILNGAPLILLVNRGSASASEILAGALQDHKRAVIVGTETFGKGTMQILFPLKDKRGLKLTVALYYTPNGRSIQAKGITPDVEVQQLLVTNQQSSQLSIKEGDLAGHLSAANKDGADKASKTDSFSYLAKDDYQLFTAVNFLKALTIT